MKKVSFGFNDIVTEQPVYIWVDCYGDRWLAFNHYKFQSIFVFRAKMNKS